MSYEIEIAMSEKGYRIRDAKREIKPPNHEPKTRLLSQVVTQISLVENHV